MFIVLCLSYCLNSLKSGSQLNDEVKFWVPNPDYLRSTELEDRELQFTEFDKKCIRIADSVFNHVTVSHSKHSPSSIGFHSAHAHCPGEAMFGVCQMFLKTFCSIRDIY